MATLRYPGHAWLAGLLHVWLCVGSLAQAQDVQTAAAAYRQAQAAQAENNFAQAAQLFELADESAPSPQAIRSAIRNHQAANNLARAATLSLQARQRYPEDNATLEATLPIIAQARRELAYLSIACSPECHLQTTERVLSNSDATEHRLYLPAGSLELQAIFATQSVTRPLSLVAGARIELALQPETIRADEPEEEPAITEPEVASPSSAESTPSLPSPQPESPAETALPASLDVTSVGSDEGIDDPSGLHVTFFTISSVLTAGLLGLSIWSGLETLTANDAYIDDPTEESYNAGAELEWQTTGLMLGTAALGITSLVLALFTRWSDESPPLIHVMLTPHGAYSATHITF